MACGSRTVAEALRNARPAADRARDRLRHRGDGALPTRSVVTAQISYADSPSAPIGAVWWSCPPAWLHAGSGTRPRLVPGFWVPRSAVEGVPMLISPTHTGTRASTGRQGKGAVPPRESGALEEAVLRCVPSSCTLARRSTTGAGQLGAQPGNVLAPSCGRSWHRVVSRSDRPRRRRARRAAGPARPTGKGDGPPADGGHPKHAPGLEVENCDAIRRPGRDSAASGASVPGFEVRQRAAVGDAEAPSIDDERTRAGRVRDCRLDRAGSRHARNNRGPDGSAIVCASRSARSSAATWPRGSAMNSKSPDTAGPTRSAGAG